MPGGNDCRASLPSAIKAYGTPLFRQKMCIRDRYGDDNSNPGYGINGNLFATGYMLGLMESIEKELKIKEKEGVWNG